MFKKALLIIIKNYLYLIIIRQETKNSRKFSKKPRIQKISVKASELYRKMLIRSKKPSMSSVKQILIYKQDNNLSTEEVAERINLTNSETKDILFYHIDYFTLDRLMTYAERLFAP